MCCLLLYMQLSHLINSQGSFVCDMHLLLTLGVFASIDVWHFTLLRNPGVSTIQGLVFG